MFSTLFTINYCLRQSSFICSSMFNLTKCGFYPLCDLKTDALHMVSPLVRIVCLFFCRPTFASDSGGFTKGFILVIQLCFTCSFISNALRSSKGENLMTCPWFSISFQISSLISFVHPVLHDKANQSSILRGIL